MADNNDDPNFRVFNDHIWEDFRYVTHSGAGTAVTYYVCIHYKSGRCRGRGVLKNGVFNLKKNHSHLPNFRDLKERRFKQDLCRRVTENDDSYRKIYDAVRPLHPEATVSVPFARTENSMFRWRKKNSPPVVNTLTSYAAVVNSNEWKHLRDYDRGSLHVSEVTDAQDLTTSVIFVDMDFAREVGNGFVNNIIFLDATFKVVPASIGGYQFLTLMTIKFNHAFPFAWALMERKTTRAHAAVFRELKRLVPGFQIHEAMTDYDKGLQRGLRQEFPQVVLHGCFFHYTQGLYKKAISLGLHRFLQQNHEGAHTLRQIMALALLPANEIRNTYFEIVESVSLQTRLKMERFFEYFEAYWLLQVTPEIFSVYGLLRRTNNVLESYHRTLKQKFGVHSNTWMFTKTLVKYQQGLWYDLASLKHCYQVTRLPKVKNQMKDQLLLDAWARLNQPNRPTALQFVEQTMRIIVDPLMEYLTANGAY